jgi:hypothetical protein
VATPPPTFSMRLFGGGLNRSAIASSSPMLSQRELNHGWAVKNRRALAEDNQDVKAQ